MLISPFVEPGSVNETPYNHHGLLRSIEDLFGLRYLGYAGRPGLKAFGTDVFSLPVPALPSPLPAKVDSTCRAEQRGRAVTGLRLHGRMLSFRARRTARCGPRPACGVAALAGSPARGGSSPAACTSCASRTGLAP